jgi:hypothetical protein
MVISPPFTTPFEKVAPPCAHTPVSSELAPLRWMTVTGIVLDGEEFATTFGIASPLQLFQMEAAEEMSPRMADEVDVMEMELVIGVVRSREETH